MKTMTVQEFITLLPKRGTELAYTRFYKKLSKEGGMYSYDLRSFINWEEFEKLSSLKKFENYGRLFNYFSKESTPFNMKIEVLRVEREKVDSNNIYTIMAAPQRTFYRASFEVKFEKEIVKATWECDRDTTLGYREINSFM